MVLADDLDGNGRLDLVLTTMNGNVYVFETPAEYHPLKTWTVGSEGGLLVQDCLLCFAGLGYMHFEAVGMVPGIQHQAVLTAQVQVWAVQYLNNSDY